MKPLTESYGVLCLGKALTPDGVNSNLISHSLGTLWPPASGEPNCQRRAAFKARSAKNWLGPGESSEASATFPVGSA